ncbi:hypothetical protein [Catenuloplanes atrovinosus]|uniref:Lipoprotein n=1 Tax=Catenuloplanes atrovinosus TaxID=137266 RepID=A0AAE3YKM9_9ACTN|nr:hypothetical protein [Catenuloplanes atrovinosus]MDR7275210.1 hypothetical protein [Catenuloplanes atrovinosus]
MRNIRLVASTVFCTSLLMLSACGGDNSTTTDTAAPAASATTAATTAAPAASEAPATTAASDKEICEAAVTGAKAFQDQVQKAIASGTMPGEAEIKAAMATMGEGLAIAQGGDSAVAKAAQAYVAENSKALAAADPATASETPEFQKAASDFDAACKAAGVPINFS